MNTSSFIHPEDQAALDQLKSIPFAESLIKKIMSLFDEQIAYGLNMAQRVRLSEKQLPHLYRLLPPIVEKLGIPEPEFYLEMNPMPNAYAMGETRTAITITSGLLQLMTEDEIRGVVAHECGHILCHHMLYTTMVNYIMNYGPSLPDITQSAQVALLYWNRKSELSCDRVAAYVTSPEIATSMLARLAGGSPELMYDFDLEEYAKQADEYESIRTEDLWNKTLQAWLTLGMDHPFNSVRARELLKWTRSEQFINLMADIPMCPKCHKPVEPNWGFCKYCGKKLK